MGSFFYISRKAKQLFLGERFQGLFATIVEQTVGFD